MSRVHRLVAAVVVLVLPFSSLAAETGAVVRSNASVLVNGVPAVTGFAVFEGDSIQTYQGTPATLTSTGDFVLVSGSSSIRYSPRQIELERGSATISTHSALPAKLGEISVRPSSADAMYAIHQTESGITVESRMGSVLIADASGTIALKQGMAANIVPQVARTGNDTAAESKQSAKSAPRKRGGAPVPASTTTVATAGVSHAKLYGIIAGIAGGALVVGMKTRGEASPSLP